MNILKSILAVFAGLVFIFITHSGTDFILESLGIFTPPTQRFDTPWMLWTAIAYRAVFSVIGCWITAKLAPSGPMLHAMILGGIGVLLSIAGVIVNMQLNLGANWYPIALVFISLPCAWLGGRIAKRAEVGDLR
ncbi:MAG TPA: hypothetical protein VJL58_06755 [Pyrinomonadaceae bacterium]|nr:hypothetical protein [Pyrinomonadaceae bacterium]